MQNKTAIWTASAIAAIGSGLLSLYAGVRNAAVRKLDEQGAFDAIRAEGRQAIEQLRAGQADGHIPADRELREGIQKINKEGWAKKYAIIHSRGADRFSGAWKVISAKERNHCLAFSGVVTVAAGSIGYAIGRGTSKSSKGGAVSGGDSGGAVGGYYGGDCGGDFGGGHGGCDGGGGGGSGVGF